MPEEKEFVYLGAKFRMDASPKSGPLSNAMEYRESKSKRSLFAMLRRATELSVDRRATLCTLLDSRVLPFLEYGGEMWAEIGLHKPERWWHDDIAEKLQVEFLRRLLGVNRVMQIDTIRMEMGRWPLVCHREKLAARQWNRWCQEEDTLAAKAFQAGWNVADSRQLGNDNEKYLPWTAQVALFYKSIGISYKEGG